MVAELAHFLTGPLTAALLEEYRRAGLGESVTMCRQGGVLVSVGVSSTNNIEVLESWKNRRVEEGI